MKIISITEHLEEEKKPEILTSGPKTKYAVETNTRYASSSSISENLKSDKTDKEDFGRLYPEMRKPETGISGLKHETQARSTTTSEAKKSTDTAPILAEATYFDKQYGTAMSDQGFIKIPRSLLADPVWKGLRLKYQKIFLILLENISYQEREFSIGTIRIKIQPGQICISFRRLVELCNEGVRHKADLIDLPLLQRAVSVFTKVHFSIHESIHGTTIITIKHPVICEYLKVKIDTPSDTESIHDRYTNEEREERKERKETIRKAREIDGAVALDSSPLNFEKKKQSEPDEIESALSDQKKRHFEILWKFIIENQLDDGKSVTAGIKQKDLLQWIKKYDGKDIMDSLKLSVGAEIKKSRAAYVSRLLTNKIPQQERGLISGRKFVEDFVKEHNLKHIEFKQDYFVDRNSKDQMKYCLPQQTLVDFLKLSILRSNDKEEQDARQKYYVDEVYEEPYGE